MAGDKSKYKSSKHKKKEYSRKSSVEEAKTPPLPQELTDKKMQTLIQKRDYLQQKLKYMETLNSGEKSNLGLNNTSTKRRNDEDYNTSSKKNKTNNEQVSHSDPICSDDEEQIIELRRKQRKMLLDQLKKKVTSPESSSNIETTKKCSKLVKNEDPIIELEEKAKTTDMFSEVDNFLDKKSMINEKVSVSQKHSDDLDDADGYYIVRPGDLIDKSRYQIKSVIGQGVFANVVKALDLTKSNKEVAIKIARNNDVIYQNGLKEVAMLKRIKAHPETNNHCVEFLRYFLHKGHLCIVLESLSMDMRTVIKKYGKTEGINMKAIICYSRQLLLALRLLRKLGIVHADIKPDNILVNEKRNLLKLCDYGSAEEINENELKPYLVSRFYRAPEIILGMRYGHGIDIWSTACTIYELATGKIMFTGNCNNKMLKCFMDLKGKIPNRLIRKGKFKDQHFNYNMNFLLHGKDSATGRERVLEMPTIAVTRNLQNELLKSNKALLPQEEHKVCQLRDLLDKMLMFDPNQRPSPSECLRHQFIVDTKLE